MRGMAICPAHITGFFKAELDGPRQQRQQPETQGSLGAGFSIKKGVKTTVVIKKSKDRGPKFQVRISGYQPDNTRVSASVIKKFLRLVRAENYFVDVHHDISVPVGYGLGCSGAVALSLAFALNQALNTKLSKPRIGQIAHNAEIKCKTGLGDVLASYHGGFEIRTRSGAPGIGSVKKINAGSCVVIMICFSPIPTKQFMNEKMSFINGLGGKMVNKFIRSRNIDEFQDMSIAFARHVKVMTPQMDVVIKDLHENGIKCGAALFGETVFTLIPTNMEQKVIGILRKYDDGIIIKSTIDNAGARLVRH